MGQDGLLSFLDLPQLLFCCPLGWPEELSLSGGKDQNGNLLSLVQKVFGFLLFCFLNLLSLSLSLSLFFFFLNKPSVFKTLASRSVPFIPYTSWDCPLIWVLIGGEIEELIFLWGKRPYIVWCFQWLTLSPTLPFLSVPHTSYAPTPLPQARMVGNDPNPQREGEMLALLALGPSWP